MLLAFGLAVDRLAKVCYPPQRQSQMASRSRVSFVGHQVQGPKHQVSAAHDQTEGGSRSRGCRIYNDEMRLTIPASAIPRSSPSRSEQALHSSFDDMYPHRLHVSAIRRLNHDDAIIPETYVALSALS